MTEEEALASWGRRKREWERSEITRLTAENAALREDKERLDFLDETNQSFYWPEDQPVRATIDAAKEE